MKNVCKRLFSLMLVMVLLVSIVPFQASAAKTSKKNTKSTTFDAVVVFKTDDDADEEYTAKISTNGNGSKLSEDEAKEALAKTDLADEYVIANSYNKNEVEMTENEEGIRCFTVPAKFLAKAEKQPEVTPENPEQKPNPENPEQKPNPEPQPEEVKDEYMTVEVWDDSSWVTNLSVKKGETINPTDLAKYDREGYTTTWTANTGDVIVPGKTAINAYTVIGASYEEIKAEVVKHYVAIYDGDECVETLTIEHGKTVPQSALAHYAKDGYTVSWETNGAPFTPGETIVSNDMAIGVIYNKIDNKPTQPDESKTEDVKVQVCVKGEGREKDSYLSATLTVGKNEEPTTAWIDKVLEENGKNFTYQVIKGLTYSNRNKQYEATIQKTAPAEENTPDKNKNNVIVNLMDGKKQVGESFITSSRHPEDFEVSKDLVKTLLEKNHLDRDYEAKTDRNGKLDVTGTDNMNGKYTYYVAVQEKKGNHDNMTVKFYYNGDKVGEETFKADHANRDALTKKIAQGLLEDAKLDRNYQLKTDKKGNLTGVTYKDGVFKVELDRNKNSKQKLDMTVYVDGKKVNLKNDTIEIYGGESYKNRSDLQDWLSRAMGNKFDRYDYNWDKTETKWKDGDNRHNAQLTVKLYTRKSDNTRKYDIYLDIYTNGSTKKPATTVKITNGVAKDGKVTLSEAKGVVKEYYTAKNSDGIDFDGLWLDKGQNNLFNSKDRENTIYVSDYRRNEKSVHIAIKADNVKAKTSNGNPKTGDEIFITVTVMAVSAMALAGAYVFNKKRMAN